MRPNPKVYLDSNIVSAIAKDDIPTESEALNRLLQAWDDKKFDLVTSEVTLWEISAHQDELKRRLVERTCRRLAKAQIIRWYELAGMRSYGDRHTWISTPMTTEDMLKELAERADRLGVKIDVSIPALRFRIDSGLTQGLSSLPAAG